jgi:endogenous inhibitor of DNA gyrase (YacG/DUF329 family)
MAKKVSRKSLVEKLDKVFSLYIRQRYAVNEIAECYTCGKKEHWKKQHAGHFASRRHYSTRWNEYNVQVQCPSCNIWQQGMQFQFGKNLCLQYGDNFADELMIQSQKTCKFTDVELQEKIDYYTQQTLLF